MKAFLWSLCLHIVLLGLLTYHHFAPDDAAKIVQEPPILAYAYQPIKAKPAPAAVTPLAVPAKVVTPPPAVKAVKKAVVKKPVVKKTTVKKTPAKAKPQVKTKPATVKAAAVQPQRKPFVPVRKPANVKPQQVKPVPKPAAVVAAKPLPRPVPKPAEVVAAKPLPKPVPKPAEVVPLPVVAAEPKPAVVTRAKTVESVNTDVKSTDMKVNSRFVQQQLKPGPSDAVSANQDQRKTLVNTALQAAKQGDASGSASWKEKQKQLALEITATQVEQKPEMGRKVKTFADGSSLIDTNPGCWKVPPAESSAGSIWLSTSVPCKADTTVEQIDAILEKRRGYSRD